jgi:hypothetical protein
MVKVSDAWSGTALTLAEPDTRRPWVLSLAEYDCAKEVKEMSNARQTVNIRVGFQNGSECFIITSLLLI